MRSKRSSSDETHLPYGVISVSRTSQFACHTFHHQMKRNPPSKSHQHTPTPTRRRSRPPTVRTGPSFTHPDTNTNSQSIHWPTCESIRPPTNHRTSSTITQFLATFIYNLTKTSTISITTPPSGDQKHQTHHHLSTKTTTPYHCTNR